MMRERKNEGQDEESRETGNRETDGKERGQMEVRGERGREKGYGGMTKWRKRQMEDGWRQEWKEDFRGIKDRKIRYIKDWNKESKVLNGVSTDEGAEKKKRIDAESTEEDE